MDNGQLKVFSYTSFSLLSLADVSIKTIENLILAGNMWDRGPHSLLILPKLLRSNANNNMLDKWQFIEKFLAVVVSNFPIFDIYGWFFFLFFFIIIYRIRQSTGASNSTNKKIRRNEIIGRVFDLFIKRAFSKVFSQIFITLQDANV